METPVTNSSVTCKNSDDIELHATLGRFSRHQVVLEIYDPQLVLKTSEVLSEVKIVIAGRTVYSGRAVVRSMVNTGTTMLCEVTLDETWFSETAPNIPSARDKYFGGFNGFMQQWQKLYKIVPEYKILIADMQTFFMDMRLWLEQVEAEISRSENRLQLEQEAINELAPPIIRTIDAFFDKFETIANTLDEATRSIHQEYMKRQLHPFVLCAPFAYRTFHKPLGYAGDYEMVNMMMRETEGNSLFAKIVDLWFLKQPPAEAHRNRVVYLEQKIVEETLRVADEKPLRVFNLGCGPAWEIQKFLTERHFSNKAHFTLLDFNDETLQHTSETLQDLKSRYGRTTKVDFLKRSVQQVLKESVRGGWHASQFDLVYCAGLFDYLSDQVCLRLMNLFYDMVKPGGLLLATNVDVCNPLRNGMEHLLDWHLIYRTSHQARALKPTTAAQEDFSVKSDITGVNIFIEVRKPH